MIVRRLGALALLIAPWATIVVLFLVGRRKSMTRRSQSIDVLVATGCIIIGQLEMWAPGAMRANGNLSVLGSRWVNVPAFFVSGMVLVWRRRAPMAVLAVIVVTGSIQALAVGATEGLGWYLPLLIALYTVARLCRTGSALLGLALAVAGMAIHDLSDPTISGFAEVSLFYDIIVIDWAAGRAFLARHRRTEELEDRATDLERQREEHAHAVVVEERERIARELHDLVAHSVSLVIVQCVVALELLDSGAAAPARDRVVNIERAARQALGEMRRLLNVLRPDAQQLSLAPQPGVAALPVLVEEVNAAGLPVELHIDGPETVLPPGLDLSAYRIVQEALTNTLKHAGPARSQVNVRYAPDALELTIADDGTANGTTNGLGADHGGRGLIGMRERVALFGGTLHCGPRPEGGWQVHARVPISASGE